MRTCINYCIYEYQIHSLVQCFFADLLDNVDSSLELSKLNMFQSLNQVDLIREIEVLISLEQAL